MKYLTFFLLNFTLLPTVFAEDILSLQQKTSFAYKQMKQAESEAKTAEQQTEAKKERLQHFKQMVAEAEKDLEIAYEKSKDANARMEAARKKWNELSSTLLQEWRTQDSNQ
ncbi:hypothetical protein [Nitrosomonas communis]|uniref:hypothetical protein n=1 Tax=Nitrosomonas communis TaxID=44574 RepID=UPI0026E92093|nr:hypothetical protein [Nitrosomonas communis]MCO6427558.1 hypothetical protein [Nitrosomonas communis]